MECDLVDEEMSVEGKFEGRKRKLSLKNENF
jgi:hypothetical protein